MDRRPPSGRVKASSFFKEASTTVLFSLTIQGMRLCRELLRRRGCPATVAVLANGLGMSPRAARHEIRSVRDWLGQAGLTLKSKPKVGFWVEGESDFIEAALSELVSEPRTFQLVLSQEDRLWLILGLIFFSSEPIAADAIARAVGVSERTIYYDLRLLRSRLRGHGVEISSAKGRLALVGDEIRCRSVMVEYLQVYAGDKGFLELVKSLSGRSTRLHSDSRLVLAQMERLRGTVGAEFSCEEYAQKIQNVISLAEKTFSLSLGGASKWLLSLHIWAALSRMRRGSFVDNRPDLIERLQKRPEWDMAVWLALRLEQEFRQKTPVSEIAYLALHLTDPGFQRAEYWRDQVFLVSQEEVSRVARSIVDKVEAYLGIDLSSDMELLSGLMAHLYMSVEKIREGIPVRNPLLSIIKADFPMIYEATQRACRESRDCISLSIPEEEAAFVALHIGAALERSSRKKRSWKGLVICPNGIGVARLIEARLSSQFPVATLTVMAGASPDLQSLVDRSGVDVVISTVDIPDTDRPVVRVGALLGPEDIRRIGEVVYSRKSLSENELLAISRLENSSGKSRFRKSGERSSVLPLVSLSTTRFASPDVSTAEQAIRTAGEILVDTGLVTARYVEAMVDIYRRLGPYIVVVPGVALPHAAPEDGALGLGLGVLVLETPVTFGSKENDPVKTVISLATPDYYSHMDALLELFGMLTSGLGRTLASVTTPEDVLEAFARHRESFDS